MPRVVRRKSFGARLASSLNPFDHLLQIWTDYESFDWDTLNTAIGFPLGVTLNIMYMLTRALMPKNEDVNDVFATPATRSPSGGFAYLMRFLGYVLCALSVSSAWICFMSRRYYRLFEQNVLIPPPTPSARLVRVDSAPSNSYAPWNVLGSLYNTFLSPPRAHPDEHTDVWEISVWAPPALTLQLFTLFSPVHLAVYHLSLPYTPNTYPGLPEPNPLPHYTTLLCTQLLISFALRLQQSAFKQQQTDMRVLNKEVLQEYNTKFVHPRLNVMKRDVAVQCDKYNDSVQQYTPDFHRQGFQTHSNPNYAAWTSPEGAVFKTPTATPSITPSFPRMRQPQFDRVQRTSTATTTPRTSTQQTFTTPGTSFRTPGRTSTFGTTTTSTSTSTGTSAFSEREPRDLTHSRSIRRGTTPHRTSFDDHQSHLPPPGSVGMNGLVNYSAQQNRGLSPSKGRTPLGSRVSRSSYTESLGTPLGTPRRRRHDAL